MPTKLTLSVFMAAMWACIITRSASAQDWVEEAEQAAEAEAQAEAKAGRGESEAEAGLGEPEFDGWNDGVIRRDSSGEFFSGDLERARWIMRDDISGEIVSGRQDFDVAGGQATADDLEDFRWGGDALTTDALLAIVERGLGSEFPGYISAGILLTELAADPYNPAVQAEVSLALGTELLFNACDAATASLCSLLHAQEISITSELRRDWYKQVKPKNIERPRGKLDAPRVELHGPRKLPFPSPQRSVSPPPRMAPPSGTRNDCGRHCPAKGLN